ncbi:sulfotransferase [Rhodobacteraceae bacterium NNCM2]|nr:sulfotransferase [Coraliihabitans acroporae]
MIGSYILIIGAMKSGTTTLFDLLAQHPEIAPCHPKEPGFFAFDAQWEKGFDWYESLFEFEPGTHRYGLDGSTDYAKHPFVTGVAERLAASAPRRFKLIYIMRDPLRRIESHARHVQRTKMEIGREISDRPDHGLDAGVSPVNLAVSRYAHQLDQYRAAIEAGELMTVTFEELAADQPAVMARLFDFLGLEPCEIAPLHSNQAGGRPRRPGYWQALNRAGPLTGMVKGIVPQSLRHALRRKLSKPVKVTGRFELSEAEAAELRDTLGEDLARLKAEYGVDFG